MREMHQKFLLGLLLVFILSVAFFGTAAADGTDSTPANVIMSTATGEILVTPDRAEISLTVETENTDVKVAQADNAKIMNYVMVALSSAGIPKEDIKTTGYNIYPVYDDNNSPFSKKVKLYRVTNTVVITVKDIPRAGEIIDICVANGANQVNYISFMLSPEKERSYRTAALSKAVQQTRADADAVASAMGVNITGVRDAVIGSSLPPVVYDNVMLSSKMAGAAPAMPTPVTPGEVKVSAGVTVSYLFR
jgi:uncharacterized protein YggE